MSSPAEALAPPAPGAPGLPSRLIIVAGIIVSAIGYLVFSAVQTSAVYSLTVTELLAAGPDIHGQPVRVSGNVVPGSIQREDGGLVVHFEAEDASGRVPVTYRGLLPDIFGDGVEVVVEGKLHGDGRFVASTLLAKCPSKFET